MNNIRFVANAYEVVRGAVMAGLGLGFASMRVIAREVAAGDLVVLKADSVALDRRFTLLAPKHVYQGTLPKAFTDHLRGWFAAGRTTTLAMAQDPPSDRGAGRPRTRLRSAGDRPRARDRGAAVGEAGREHQRRGQHLADGERAEHQVVTPGPVEHLPAEANRDHADDPVQ